MYDFVHFFNFFISMYLICKTCNSIIQYGYGLIKWLAEDELIPPRFQINTP